MRKHQHKRIGNKKTNLQTKVKVLAK